MTLRFSGELITLIFAVIGILITVQIKRIPRTTKFERSILLKQKKAVKRLWIVIGTFILVSLSLCFYDFISFQSQNCRVVIPDSQVLNDILWYVMRALGYQMWAIPILFVFWPVKVNHQSNQRYTESTIQQESTTGLGDGKATKPGNKGGNRQNHESFLNPLFDESSSASVMRSTVIKKDTSFKIPQQYNNDMQKSKSTADGAGFNDTSLRGIINVTNQQQSPHLVIKGRKRGRESVSDLRRGSNELKESKPARFVSGSSSINNDRFIDRQETHSRLSSDNSDKL
ncbi:hypothetical protein FGO68_gene3025 [Halteria grandinella]|uniref:Uncharacterized protein n=1 Tax=Halteria grandinella TaxID=5974 RepID=A0A8J8NRS3_HALGN|nr:hypothetical protein FGO68_gene3025 [Halteria grandinella]